jgi:hypothetical protein
MTTTFTPTQWTLEPPTRPDQLSSAVVNSLSRPIGGRVLWGPLRSFVLGGISFGIWPLIAWPRRFGRIVVAEQQQIWHLVEWLRIQTGDPEAEKVRDSVRSTGATPSLWLVPWTMLAIIALNAILWFRVPGRNLDSLLAATYRFDRFQFDQYTLRSILHDPYSQLHLFSIWTICLTVAFVSHWLHVRRHVADMNALIGRINVLLVRQNAQPAGQFRTGLGLAMGFRHLLWGAAAVAGCAAGAWWAIPAAVAGAAHQRYAMRTSVRLRGELALRARNILERQRPSIQVPPPGNFKYVCRNEKCLNTLKPGTLFCPRCGTRAQASLYTMA